MGDSDGGASVKHDLCIVMIVLSSSSSSNSSMRILVSGRAEHRWGSAMVMEMNENGCGDWNGDVCVVSALYIISSKV